LSAGNLNNASYAKCFTGKDKYYDIEGDVSPLTGEKDSFKCAEIEVYKVTY